MCCSFEYKLYMTFVKFISRFFFYAIVNEIVFLILFLDCPLQIEIQLILYINLVLVLDFFFLTVLNHPALLVNKTTYG